MSPTKSRLSMALKALRQIAKTNGKGAWMARNALVEIWNTHPNRQQKKLQGRAAPRPEDKP